MNSIMHIFLERFKVNRVKSRIAAVLTPALAIIVAFCVFGQLCLTGITMTNETYCGLEEHTHTDECYADVLICGQEENERHTHTADCYETQLVCGLEEHTHTAACEIADITEAETAAPSTEKSSENTSSEAVSSESST
ncbi:MAG: hypothetical protein LIO40_03205 [Ruminococcus sp.]|nr:hypothetical protein [Ruminococcus sp.]